MQWDTAGSEVYVPLWRGELPTLAPVLNSVTIHALPGVVANLTQFAGRIPDPPGTLLTREQRAGRAAEWIGHALALALIDHGWKLHLQPGQIYLESENGSRINPRAAIAELRNGNQKPDAWLQFCETNAIGDWPLAPQAAEAAG
jgi:hypothetical protein